MIDSGMLSAEILRAKLKQMACERDGDRAGVEAWHGYIQALRWVEAQGVPDSRRAVIPGPDRLRAKTADTD